MTPPRARFGGIDIVPKNVAECVAFYRELGLDIPDDQIWSSNGLMHHVDVHHEGEYTLDLDSEQLTASYDPNWSSPGVVLIFRTDTRDDVDALHDHMVGLGHPSHRAPFDAFWGARYAMLVDPAGNLVSLMSPQDRSTSTTPPPI
jgi:uncharacterized glyoxalase superfamily protein PhnB